MPLSLFQPELVSVILPTFNEKGSIGQLIDEIHEVLEINHEIVVVDDNSPDGTYEHVLGLSSTRPYLRALKRTQDPSLAKSIRHGLDHARGDAMVIMDSDFNHQPFYLPFMVSSLRYYECVSGSRFLYGGSMNHKTRHFLSWLFNVFTRFMTGGNVTDSLYGFLAIRRSALKKCDFDKIFWGYGDYCIRLLFYLQRLNIDVLQFPALNGSRIYGTGNSRFFQVFRIYFMAVLHLTYQERLCRRDSVKPTEPTSRQA